MPLIHARCSSWRFDAQGHQTHPGSNGSEAVEAARAHVFDAVVIDAEMPVMDGLESARKIRELSNGAQLSMILLTAYHDIKERVSVPEATMDLDCIVNRAARQFLFRLSLATRDFIHRLGIHRPFAP